MSGGGGFPTTRWSLVARAAARRNCNGDGEASAADADVRREALGHLLRQYLPALRAHLLGRRVPADRAEDLVQSFVADKVIERNLLAAADRARGRFRAFLATALDHFAANQLRHDTAQKRAPQEAKLLAWDAEGGLEPAAAADGGAFDPFEVAWARETLAEAVRRVRDECVATGRPDLWEVLGVRVLRPALDGVEPLPYGEMVRRFGYATPKQAANALVTAKRRLEQALRSVLAEYVLDEEELEQELVSLGRALAAAPHAWAAAAADDGAGLDAAPLPAAPLPNAATEAVQGNS